MVGEKTQATSAVDAMQSNVPAVKYKPGDFKVGRRLTMDATSIVRLGEVIFQVTGEFEELEMPPAAKGADPGKATGIPIYDVVREQHFLLICNALLVSALMRAVPPLVNRFFAAKSGPIKEGKRYRTIDCFEVFLVK